MPVVTIEADTERPDFDWHANSDNARTMRLLLDHLAAAGARRIALVAPAWPMAWAVESVAAYRAWCAEHAMPELLDTEAAPLLDLAEPPDAIVGMVERVAAGVVAAARSRGLDVPGDLLVASAMDSAECREGSDADHRRRSRSRRPRPRGGRPAPRPYPRRGPAPPGPRARRAADPRQHGSHPWLRSARREASVVRDGEVLVVHRPRYDDWSLPKGKLERGESWEEAALREVLEETGVGGRLLRELDGDSYTDRKGRPKQVRWWLMQPVAIDAREPDDEVDEVRWVPLDEAEALLSYAHDRALVAGLIDA